MAEPQSIRIIDLFTGAGGLGDGLSSVAICVCYFIRCIETQSRSMTVREAARLQTDSENLRVCGSRRRQYRRVETPAPPPLAHRIASLVVRILNGAESKESEAQRPVLQQRTVAGHG